jgi:hypothetical protein
MPITRKVAFSAQRGFVATPPHNLLKKSDFWYVAALIQRSGRGSAPADPA